MDVKSVGLPSEIRTSRGLMWKAPIVCDLPKIIKSKLKKEEEKIKFKTFANNKVIHQPTCIINYASQW